jgi:hypothetical protein
MRLNEPLIGLLFARPQLGCPQDMRGANREPASIVHRSDAMWRAIGIFTVLSSSAGTAFELGPRLSRNISREVRAARHAGCGQSRFAQELTARVGPVSLSVPNFKPLVVQDL